MNFQSRYGPDLQHSMKRPHPTPNNQQADINELIIHLNNNPPPHCAHKYKTHNQSATLSIQTSK